MLDSSVHFTCELHDFHGSCTTSALNSDVLHLLHILISMGWVIFKFLPPLHILTNWCIQTSCIQETGLDFHPPYWNPLTLSGLGLLREELNDHDCKTNTHTQALGINMRHMHFHSTFKSPFDTLLQSHTRAAAVIFCNGRSIKHIEESEIPFFDPLPSSCLRQSDAPPLPWRRLAKATSQSCMKDLRIYIYFQCLRSS